MKALSLVVHGESGVGKSWLGDSAPAPRLILDAEGGSRFTPSQPKVVWDPIQDAPPTEGIETVITFVRDFATMQRVYQWLNSGQHGFRSVILDSLTEIQKRCLDAIAGVNQPTQQDWGSLLRQMEALVREFRDLTIHPVRPLEVVAFLATTSLDEVKERRPNLQGRLRLTLPAFVDVVGYMYAQPGETGDLNRILLTAPYPGYVAKDRTDRLDDSIVNPNITEMLDSIYGKENPNGNE